MAASENKLASRDKLDSNARPRPAPAVATTPKPVTRPATALEAIDVDRLPSPEEIASDPGDPDAPAPPPGRVPGGDSRSLRRSVGDREEFVLVYRVKCAVIVRSGRVGVHGGWEVVAYPTPGAAGNGYARRCAKLCGDGFGDFVG